ncbi:MAG: N-acetyltransferase family protein [Candidatus Dormibacteria bacterium]|jgi:phosphinothricin acetyltransferase
MPAELMVRLLEASDWPAVREIYAAGIATGEATFEEEPPSWEVFDGHRLASLRFVATDAAGVVVGWVAAAAVSDRCVYAGVIEHSVYVDPALRGRGIGRLLLDHLIAASEAAGIWTIQSGIFPENAASRALHARCGFREVGIRERLGRHRGRWRDVVMVERRSSTVI